MYVVLVDDEPADIRRMSVCVPATSFQRIESYTKPEELRALLLDVKEGRKPEPALILLDMKIGQDGEAGLKMLREVREAIPHMPVIIVSGSKLHTVIVESYKQGAVSYIHKSQREGVFEHRISEMFVYFSAHTKIPATADLPDPPEAPLDAA